MLALEPGCDMAEFKQAYRRRVATLHPDRRDDSFRDTESADQLQQLTALYSAAVAFERRHGRLPGAASARAAESVITRGPRANASDRAVRKPSSRWLLIALAITLAVVWLTWNPAWFVDNTEPDSSTISAAAPAQYAEFIAPVHALRDTLQIGMTTDMVRRIEGQPLLLGDNRWNYGPSWIRFEKGRVVDWYSSPLRPLDVDASNPPSADH
jgi:hypothetical protein